MIAWIGRSRAAFASFVVALAFGCGCLAAPAAERGYPLYPSGGERPQPNHVATLGVLMPGGSTPGTGANSFIKSVDGRDVANLDASFELLPGCHVVQTESRLVVTNGTLTFRGELGSRVFAFRMRAGFQYVVVVEFAQSTGSTVRVSVYGEERDVSGIRTQQVAPATGPADLQACRAWNPTAS